MEPQRDLETLPPGKPSSLSHVHALSFPHTHTHPHSQPPSRFHDVEPQRDLETLPPGKLSARILNTVPRSVPPPSLSENTMVLSDEGVVGKRDGKFYLMFRCVWERESGKVGKWEREGKGEVGKWERGGVRRCGRKVEHEACANDLDLRLLCTLSPLSCIRA